MRVKGSAPKAGASAVALYERIRSRIADGTYRSGQALPKTRYFVLTEYCSNDTVRDAIRLLEKEGLVHKQRRRWVVGPPVPIHPRSVRFDDRPVVLILSTDLGYHSLLFEVNYAQFSAPFINELKSRFIEYRVAFNDWDMPVEAPFPVGREGILSLVNSLGRRYQGTLVMVHATTSPQLPDQLSWLCQFDKPVVWLDPDCKAPQWDRRAVARPNFFRGYSDERRAMDLVIDQLYEAGHRKVGFPLYGPYVDGAYFLRERIERARQCVDEHGYDIEIIVPPVRPEPWDTWVDTTDRDIFQALAGIRSGLSSKHPDLRGARFERLFGRELLSRTPTLSALLSDPKLTAIIAGNEWLAITYYYWLTRAGISIPRDLSIVGFDNYRRFMQHPSATLDLKLDELGYLAAHLFIGDVPIRRDRRGNVAARPEFIDRGAIGPARTGKAGLLARFRK
ncbi:MAG: GntR family transcriptional regulator [Chitinivibrionales bacterium]|nr:GntR family transcriptional regulator [Chitinivibrionales bacterium]MBD3396002.1 GntR family transcriptional regulator [Chitinivibrionales bacterium]